MAVPARLSPREGRKFAFTVGGAFVVLAGISAWRGHHYPPRVLGAIGILLLVAGTVAPRHLGGLQSAWTKLGLAVSKVTAPIMLGVVYFLILTPIGSLMRAFGRNPLRHRERDGSFWARANESRSNLHSQF